MRKGTAHSNRAEIEIDNMLSSKSNVKSNPSRHALSTCGPNCPSKSMVHGKLRVTNMVDMCETKAAVVISDNSHKIKAAKEYAVKNTKQRNVEQIHN